MEGGWWNKIGFSADGTIVVCEVGVCLGALAVGLIRYINISLHALWMLLYPTCRVGRGFGLSESGSRSMTSISIGKARIHATGQNTQDLTFGRESQTGSLLLPHTGMPSNALNRA